MNCKYIFENKEYTFDELKVLIKSKYKEEFKKNGFSEYSSYIARVSLGIIKNPSSGEYNYESKVKDIVYHGSNQKFDEFKKNQKGRNLSGGRAFYFTTDIEKAENYSKNEDSEDINNIYHVLLDVKSPNSELVESGQIMTEEEIKSRKRQGYDGLFLEDEDSDYIEEYVVFEPEQIHVLGGKNDIQGFKDYMTFQNSEFAKYGTYEQFREFIANKSSMEIENRLIETGKIDRVC